MNVSGWGSKILQIYGFDYSVIGQGFKKVLILTLKKNVSTGRNTFQFGGCFLCFLHKNKSFYG